MLELLRFHFNVWKGFLKFRKFFFPWKICYHVGSFQSKCCVRRGLVPAHNSMSCDILYVKRSVDVVHKIRCKAKVDTSSLSSVDKTTLMLSSYDPCIYPIVFHLHVFWTLLFFLCYYLLSSKQHRYLSIRQRI